VATEDSIMCGLFWACELANDVPRADQWMRAAADLLRRRNVVAAFCGAHYGGILTAAGRWDEAETELVQAAQLLDGLDRHPDAVRTGDRPVAPGQRRAGGQGDGVQASSRRRRAAPNPPPRSSPAMEGTL
jgi:hypothetical protein